ADPKAEPAAGPAERPAKPLPSRLVGTWELRADDGRTGSMEFRPDGTMSVSTTIFDFKPLQYEGDWSLVGEDGDRLVIELGVKEDIFGRFRFTMVVNPEPDNDALTILETAQHGSIQRDPQRF